MIEYRVAVTEDIKGMFQLFQELKGEKAQVGFTKINEEKDLSQWMEDDTISLFVAVDSEKDVIVGVLRAKRGSTYKNHSAFLTAAIAKNYRGNKIAKSLTYYGLEELIQIGVKIARTYVYSNNKASLNTLLSCGFTISGTVHMHHFSEESGQYVDDIIVHKILK
jgi:ribosomal protein S18 acetylase RimI-like enzyme